MAGKILIACTNPWSFCLAVERHLAQDNAAEGVDVLNLFRLSGSESPHWRPRDVIIERINRKIERFVAPAVSGREITKEIEIDLAAIPPPPQGPFDLRGYRVGSAAVGLGTLSSVTEVTTITSPLSMAEFGSDLQRAWRSAHLAQQVGRQVATMGYERVYIFGGRHCYSRPFVDEVERFATVVRYEQGAFGNSYVTADTLLYKPSTHAQMVEEHDFNPAAGEAFFKERINRDPRTDAGFFTRQQEQGAVPQEVRGSKFVSFFTSSPDEYLSVTDDLSFGEFDSQYAAAMCLARLCRRAGLKLVIRFHPHLKYKHNSWMREWNFGALADEDAVLVYPEAKCDSYALIRSSNCVVTCGSTVGFESAFIGIPNAAVGEWLTTHLGASVYLRTSADIHDFLQRPTLPARARDSAMLYGSFKKTAGEHLRNLDVGKHPSFARIDGRIVDPVRCAVQKVRDCLSGRSPEAGILDTRSGMRDGKVVLALRARSSHRE